MSTPKSIKEAAKDLSPLESFHSSAFQKNSKVPQSLCDFMLTLSLFSNDLKDVVLLQLITEKSMPTDMATITPELGQFNGIMVHIERLFVSRIFELFKFFEKNQEIIFSNELKKVLRLLPKPNRDCWDHLISVSLNKSDQSNNAFRKILALVRNRTAFHYDKDKIAQGYKHSFIQKGNEPMISRGTKISQCRFYYADEAARAYFANSIKGSLPEDFSEKLGRVIDDVAMSLSAMVSVFINQQSGFGEIKTKKLSEINK